MTPLIIVVVYWTEGRSKFGDFETYRILKLTQCDSDLHFVLCPPFHKLAHSEKGAIGSSIKLGIHNHTTVVDHLSLQAARLGGAEYIVFGHPEERNATDQALPVLARVRQAISSGLKVIVCVGETALERDEGRAGAAISRQLRACLPDDVGQDAVSIAYLPKWAFEEQVTPSLYDIKYAFADLRDLTFRLFGRKNYFRLLYAGPLSQLEPLDILNTPNVDGLLGFSQSIEIADLASAQLFNP